MESVVERVLVSEEEIEEITRRIAAKINEDYKDSGKQLLIVCILKGSLMFTSALMKRINLPVEIDFMRVSSYGAGTKSSGNIIIKLNLERKDLHERDILIIEDIVDSGRTLNALTTQFREIGVKSVRTCTLLDKPSRREVDFTPDYIGKEIPDEFVVGYGLDYAENYRTLPYVAILKPRVYKSK